MKNTLIVLFLCLIPPSFTYGQWGRRPCVRSERSVQLVIDNSPVLFPAFSWQYTPPSFQGGGSSSYQNGGSYQNQGNGQVSPEIRALARAIVEELRAAGMNGGSAPAKSAKTLEEETRSILNNRCAQCHQGSMSKSNNYGKIQLLDTDGKVVLLGKQKNNGRKITPFYVFRMVEHGLMPLDQNNQPTKSVTDDELSVLEEWVASKEKD